MVPVRRQFPFRFSGVEQCFVLIKGDRFYGHTRKMCHVYDLLSARFGCGRDAVFCRKTVDRANFCRHSVIELPPAAGDLPGVEILL